MTVVELTVDSFKRIRAAHLTPAPTGLVPVRGRNAQGKSSLIESMLAALLGKRGASALPITEGAHGAEVVLDLGEIVVRRKWRRDSAGKATTSLTVESASGGKIASPQAILDHLVGHFADPVAFLAMTAEEQVKTVLAVTGVDAALGRLEADAIQAFEHRRDVGRDADRLTKAEAGIREELANLPQGLPDDVDLGALAARLQIAKASEARAATLDARRVALEEQGGSLKKRIDEATAALAAMVEERAAVASAWKAVHAEAKAHVVIDTAPIVAQIQAHEEAARAAGRRELLERSVADAEAARQAHAEADEALAAIRAQIAELLAGVQFPLEGLSYDAEAKVLSVNGIPFSGASQAERIKVAAAVAMAGEPPIRVMFAREGSLLDEESKLQLAALAEERGFQLWLEVVDSNPFGAGVWVEDGEATESSAG